jgi:regulatory protein YycI of two-component signal transduction system YycFG
MNYKKTTRAFIIFLILLSIIVFSIPGTNHYNHSFVLHPGNNIEEKSNNTTLNIIKGCYSSAVFRTYGGRIKLDPDNQMIANETNYLQAYD